MRTIHLVLAATAFLGAAAGATPASVPDLQPTFQQLHEIEGSYRLANGDRADVQVLDQHLFVEVRHQRKELVMVGAERFESRDGSISLRYEAGAPDKVVLGYRPETVVRSRSCWRRAPSRAAWATDSTACRPRRNPADAGAAPGRHRPRRGRTPPTMGPPIVRARWRQPMTMQGPMK